MCLDFFYLIKIKNEFFNIHFAYFSLSSSPINLDLVKDKIDINHSFIHFIFISYYYK